MKQLKDYLKETIGVEMNMTSRFHDVADALDKLGTRDAMHLADKIFDFIQMHEHMGYPEGELKSIKDDVMYYAKKWGHIKFKNPTDRLGELVLGLRNGNIDAPVDIDQPNIEMEDVMEGFNPVDEEAEYDYGTDDYYDPESKTFKKMPIEFVDKGKADLEQKTNNPRYGDNSLKDVTVNEDLSVDENLKLDELQTILNNAGISDDEIISGIAGLKPDAKARVAEQLGVPLQHVDFMINELSTKLSHEDEKNYSLFSESYLKEQYKKLFEEDDRFGYQEDALGNVTINDTLTGNSKFIEGTEAQDLLRKLFSNPNNTQKILGNYANLMEEKKEKPKNWKAAGLNNPKELFSKQIKEKDGEKPKDLSDKKPPFANTIKLKKKIKSVNESEDDDGKWEKHWTNDHLGDDVWVVYNTETLETTKAKYSNKKDAVSAFRRKTSKFQQSHNVCHLNDLIKKRKEKKSLKEAVILDEETDFLTEIHSNDSGSYNFPWKSGALTGTGTAFFSVKNDEPVIKLISVRDNNGNEIEDYNHDDILEQAKRFIPEA
jgi:hypothetical protein